MQVRILDQDVTSSFPAPDYQVIWRYNRRLVVHSRLTGQYAFYKADGNMWQQICQNEDFFRGREVAEEFWNPKQASVTINTLDLLMDQVDSLVSSVVIKGQQAKLTKYDFSAVYFGSDHAWHAFYPSVESLVEFHSKLPAPNQVYLDYLNSQELSLQRKAWDEDLNVTVPAQK